jgi:hypothetical protein
MAPITRAALTVIRGDQTRGCCVFFAAGHGAACRGLCARRADSAAVRRTVSVMSGSVVPSEFFSMYSGGARGSFFVGLVGRRSLATERT